MLENFMQSGLPLINKSFFWYIWGDEFNVIFTGTWSESSSAKGSCTQLNESDLSIRMSNMSES